MNKIVFCFFLLATCSVFSFAKDTQTAVQKELNYAAYDLAWNYLRAVPDNEVLCPHGLSVLLTALREGAKGDTRSQIAEVLGSDQPVDVVQNGLKLQFAESAEPGSFAIYNGVWIQKDAKIQPAFQKFLSEKYAAGFGATSTLESVDFKKEPQDTLQKINQWFSKNTEGKVPQLFEQIDVSTKLICGNVVFFKSDWVRQFDDGNTRPDDFYVDEKTTVKVPMMFQMGMFQYYAQWDMEALAMRYRNGMWMVILLPRNQAAFDYLKNNLNGEYFEDILCNMKPTRVDVYIPRFSQRTRLNLADTLKEMGMPDAFGEKADFSGINGKKDLMLGNVVQEVVIDVTEKGTEAVAASGAALVGRGKYEAETFCANRPFLYAIVSEQENQPIRVLFIGTLANPSK